MAKEREKRKDNESEEVRPEEETTQATEIEDEEKPSDEKSAE